MYGCRSQGGPDAGVTVLDILQFLVKHEADVSAADDVSVGQWYCRAVFAFEQGFKSRKVGMR